jgi:hypothetical protein
VTTRRPLACYIEQQNVESREPNKSDLTDITVLSMRWIANAFRDRSIKGMTHNRIADEVADRTDVMLRRMGPKYGSLTLANPGRGILMAGTMAPASSRFGVRWTSDSGY